MDKSVFRPTHSQSLNAAAPFRPSKSKQPNFAPFSAHLQSAVSQSKLTVSKHAEERLRQRGIEIHPEHWKQIEDKVKEAKGMGISDSLVLLKDAALIVSAKNNTVITAMNRKEASGQIFTNINGTIVLET
ncbi:TIGR02530 family flagellar biosynthesis protein [Mesobacillus harenae]|uniref:TIGR02530 family flagellar biosynthesis protein n=1 Tax=Mesobacillus harenae TaxID=2213203 RepID=UPI00158013E8|nr:TIGR02530 family flagellar biosynthesis protein [Mesobacillus harenae]